MSHTHDLLAKIVAEVKCLPGWSFRLQKADDDVYPKLVIRVHGFDSSNFKTTIVVDHFYPVPEATYNEASWRRWIFERCRGVMNHELGEWFRIGSDRPFQPLHGPGEDPYLVHEFRPIEDALTTQNGSRREPYA